MNRTSKHRGPRRPQPKERTHDAGSGTQPEGARSQKAHELWHQKSDHKETHPTANVTTSAKATPTASVMSRPHRKLEYIIHQTKSENDSRQRRPRNVPSGRTKPTEENNSTSKTHKKSIVASEIQEMMSRLNEITVNEAIEKVHPIQNTGLTKNVNNVCQKTSRGQHTSVAQSLPDGQHKDRNIRV